MIEQEFRKIVGEVPFPLAVTDSENIVDIYFNSSMVIFDSRRGIDFPSDYHAHSSYEFIIPITSLAIIKLDENTLPVEFNKLMPINPEQDHGSPEQYKNCQLLGWHIDIDLVKSIAKAMYGKSAAIFSNDFIPVSKELHLLLGWFMEEYKHKQAGMSLVLDTLAAQLVITLLRQVRNSCSYMTEKHILSANPNIERTIEYLNDNYQSHFSLQNVADIANLSPYHFLRLFKNQTGKTPYAYLVDIKIEKAKEMLRSKKHTVTEVCFLCGFNNASHFATLFKKKVGVTPSDYSKL